MTQLQQFGLKGVRMTYVPNYENSTALSPKHLELWFAALREQAPPQANPAQQQSVPSKTSPAKQPRQTFPPKPTPDYGQKGPPRSKA